MGLGKAVPFQCGSDGCARVLHSAAAHPPWSMSDDDDDDVGHDE